MTGSRKKRQGKIYEELMFADVKIFCRSVDLLPVTIQIQQLFFIDKNFNYKNPENI